MLVKNITYTNFDGNNVTGKFYFNLTKAELLEMELELGLSNIIERIAETNNNRELFKVFKTLILRAYGKKNDDGHFVKSPEISEEFSHTEAYSELFIELTSDANKASDFINAIIPVDLKNSANANHPKVTTMLQGN